MTEVKKQTPQQRADDIARSVNIPGLKYQPPQEEIIKRTITLHRNGDPIRFDITINVQRLVECMGARAERNSSHTSELFDGVVRVRHFV